MKVSFKFVFLLFYVSIGSFSCALMEQFLSLWNCSLLKETVYRHGTVAVHLCVLLPFIKETSIYDFLFACLGGKILQNRFINAKKFVLKGANSFPLQESKFFHLELTPFVREAEIKMAGLISQ